MGAGPDIKDNDPTARFTDMQWFMFNQHNVAYYAAFASRPYDTAQLVAIAQRLVDLAPQLKLAYRGANPDAPISEVTLRRLISIETVRSFDGFPDVWVNSASEVTSDPDLPLFRIKLAIRQGGPDAQGRAAFLIVRVSHALVEGADSASLTRSRSAAHPVRLSARRTSPLVRLTAAALGRVLAGLHLLAGNTMVIRPGPFRFETRAYPRALFLTLARELEVRQRALFFALVMHVVFDAGTPAGKRRISSTYSTVDAGGGADRDSFMRMRMLFGRFENAPDFAAFARAVDTSLRVSEAKESGFNAEMNAAGLASHRKLSKLIPFAYSPKLFQFMPFDIVIGLIPPHRLYGALTEGLVEPVYCGAETQGANACVIVPGRRMVSFNFFLQQRLIPKVAVLDVRLEELSGHPPFISDVASQPPSEAF